MSAIAAKGLYVSRLLQVVATALTVGMVMCVGMILAPTLFANVEHLMAVKTMSLVFAKLTNVLLVLLGLFVVASVTRVALSSERKLTKMTTLKLVLGVAFVAFSLYNLLVATPPMIDAVNSGAALGAEFQQAHTLSRQLFMVESGLALLLAILLI